MIENAKNLQSSTHGYIFNRLSRIITKDNIRTYRTYMLLCM